MSGARRRFVISHVGRDRPWAEWIAARLADAGEPGSIEVRLVGWRWDTGRPLADALHEALFDEALFDGDAPAERVVLVFSASLLEAHAYVHDRPPNLSLLGKVVPVRIEPVSLPEPWAGMSGPTLFDAPPAEAADRLVAAVLGRDSVAGRQAPVTVSPHRPRLPGHRPDVWNVPARDDVFVNERLLRGGFARTLTIRPNDRYEGRFRLAEARAQASRRGLWGRC